MGDESEQRLRESLSALIDGEATELELRRVLERLGEGSELRETAINYQRIGAAIRHEPSAFANIDLSSSIRAAIADEFPPELEESAGDEKSSGQKANSGKKAGWIANLTRFAVAASVAVAAVVGVQSWQLANRSDAGIASEMADLEELEAPLGNNTISSEIATSGNFGVRGIQAGLGTEPSGMTPEQISHAHGYAAQVAQARFRAYMLEHAEQASAYGGSVVPFVRAASFDTVPR